MTSGPGRDDAALQRRLIECSPVVTFVVDAIGRITWVNDAVVPLSGYTPDEIIGTNILDHMDVTWNPLAFESVGYAMAGHGLRRPMLFRVKRKDGSTIVCEATANAQLDDPVIDGLAVYMRRWDERVLLDQIVETIAAGSPLETTLELVTAIIASETLEADGAVLYRPDDLVFHRVVAAATLDDDLVGRECAGPWSEALATGELVVRPVDDLPPDLAERAASQGYQICWAWPVPDLSADAVAACLVVWRRDDESPDHTCTMAMERLVRLTGLVLDRERSVTRLEHAATHDPLTDLPDRAVFYRQLQEHLDGPDLDETIGVLYLDLDDFKPVNDRLGHGAGDQVLIEIGRRLRQAVRRDDLVARLGGDEFAIVCPHIDDLETLTVLGDRLVTAIRAPLPVEGQPTVGVSIGITAARPGEATVDELVERADAALYTVKERGKGGWLVAASLAADAPAGAGRPSLHP